MKSCLRIIFLSSFISYHVGATATPKQTALQNVRQKAQHTYLVACQKTRALYEKTKKHKKVVAAIAAYVVFECIGYTQEWRTPFCRLFVLPGKLDAELRTARTTIHAHVTQIAQLNHDHQQELQKQQQEQQELQQRYEEVRRQLDDLLATDMGQQLQQSQEAYQELTQKYQEIEKQLQSMQRRQNNLKKWYSDSVEELLKDVPSAACAFQRNT